MEVLAGDPAEHSVATEDDRPAQPRQNTVASAVERMGQMNSVELFCPHFPHMHVK